ncbi:hypothetical protein [Thioclava sp. GXIMD2076]|uniref:acylneuraminate cytidylyltransferase family protein n=1 Tax=Thioclava sp. GXIMD2076 TaxID=3131931 RepID=UPI0030D02D08
MKNVSVFFPLRAGSTRAVGKNTRPFRPDGRSLFQHKMEQLVQLADTVAEVIVSTNDKVIAQQFEEFSDVKNLRLVERPEALCLSTTKVQDLIDYVPTVVEGEHIFWLHATSPFVDERDYKEALDIYSSRVINAAENDSIMSVNKLQQFIWDDATKRVINCDREVNPWPNTQDLAPLYEINHAFYISSRDNYLKLRDRIGQNPVLYEMTGIKKTDIDWEDDFEVAQNLLDTYERSRKL